MPRLYWKTDQVGNITLSAGNVEIKLGRLPAETAMALSHELARYAGDQCPCHRETHPQRFIDRLNSWTLVK
jgi:hypothetical protein